VGQRFCAEYGAKRLSEVTADDIREWLAELTHPRTSAPMDPITKKHHRQNVNTFLDRARREGWIMRNPCEIVAVPEVEDGDVVVISPEDAFRFFKANIDEPVVARVALEAFGALRYSTAGRIHREHLNFEEKGIEMPGRMHKSGKRKWRQGQPALLWEWLGRATDVTWGMSLLNYREWKRAALIRAGLRPLGVASDEDRDTLHGLRNIWRHSFASYMLASTKNMPLVGYLMQHTKTTTTEIYEGVATEADARLYLALTPGNVAKARDWADFKRRVGKST
jgi:site-specific recombinase XerD